MRRYSLKLLKKSKNTFAFKAQGSGIATIAKQLDTYRALAPQLGNEDSADQASNELSFGLDCKFPTVITGLVIQEIAAQLNLQVDTHIRFKVLTHPSLLVQVISGKSKQTFFIDFRNRIPDGNASKTSFSSYIEKRRWEYENSITVFSLHKLNATLLDASDKRGYQSAPLSLETLVEMDQAFITS